MKKIIRIFAGLLTLVLVGCTQTSASPTIYSFSGGREELRIINGVAVVGSQEETFYGGVLELDTSIFKNVKEYTIRFYIEDEEPWEILHHSVQGEIFDLENQDLGTRTGHVLKENMDVKDLQEHLYFEMKVTFESGKSESFTFPMKVQQIHA